MKQVVIKGRSLSKGRASGEAIVTKDPILFNGGVDPLSGAIVETGHELQGQIISAKILVFPYGKGSTGGSFVIYQMEKLGTGPRAMICLKSETITTIGAIMGNIPLMDSLEQNPLEIIKTGDHVEVNANENLVKITKM
ncbi:MAG: DUF126 domain-containing protein [Candidatus Bathyarchaeia archaeon]|jgi:predicted aconitase with swiveling domain